MLPRKKFRADITDKSIENSLSKGSKRKRKEANTEKRSANISVLSIPSQLLVDKINLKPRVRKPNVKPENWIKNQEEPKLSRAEVLKKERLNIEKSLDLCQNWSRAARSLSCAIKPNANQPLSLCIEDVEDREGLAPDGHLPRQERKNLSKEFLETFFKRADEILTETKASVPKKRPRTPARIIPRFAAGVKPGSDEIVL